MSSTGIIAQEIGDVVINISDSDIIDLSSTGTITINSSNIGAFSSDDYTINISPSREEFDSVVERLEKLEKILTEEAELRANHPALKTAYDEYRLLLVLAKQHSEPLDN